jgi:hypothetical protein
VQRSLETRVGESGAASPVPRELPIDTRCMRNVKRILFALFGLLLLSACAVRPETAAPAVDSSAYVDYHDDDYNFDVTYPEHWSRGDEQLTILGNPNELLALATFPLPQGGGCAPKRALDEADSTDAIIFLVEFTATAGRKPPPRPPSFDPLPKPQMDDCWDAPVATYLFRDSGGRFQVDVWLGDHVSNQTKEEIIRILDSLRFSTREQEGSFFDRVNRILKQRDTGILSHATEEQRKGAVPLRELRAKVRRNLANHHPNARLIDVTLGVFTSTNKRLGSYRKLMYVVHTGPFSTGDCLDFYDAKTLHFEIGSCFLTDRDL